MTLYRTCLN